MKNVIITFVLLVVTQMSFAQKFWTQTGQISFFSKTPMEDIEAVNKQVSSILDTETGDLVFNVLMKAFLFEKALMQEHFNEKYVHSEKYPKASFKGQIVDFSKLNLTTTAEQKVQVKGILTMHGISKEVVAEGTVKLDAKKNIVASSKFEVLLADYDISIPSAVKENISEKITISVVMNYVPYEK